MIVRKKDDWLAAKVGEELVMMSTDNGQYLSLSETGTRIWELMAVPQTIEHLCAQLVEQFEVPLDVCQTEVETFLRELEKHGAVTLDPRPAA